MLERWKTLVNPVVHRVDPGRESQVMNERSWTPLRAALLLLVD